MSLTYKNNVEFSLFSLSKKRTVIPEPVNFEDGNGNIYERDKNSKGFLKTKSNSLKFFAEGYDFLFEQFVSRGVAEDVILQKRIKSNERWRIVSEVFLDMGKCKFNDSEKTVQTEATQGGLLKQIESKFDDEFDMIQQTSSNGDDIGFLKTVNVDLGEKEIFLRSELSVEDGTLIKATVSGGDLLNARAIPFKVDVNSDQEDITYVNTNKLRAANNTYATLTSDTSANCFYTNADLDTNIILNGRVEIRMVNTNLGSLEMSLVYYINGDDLNYDSSRRISLGSMNPNIQGNVLFYDFDDFVVPIRKGDSLTIGVLTDTLDGVSYEVYNTSLFITENSSFPPTITRATTLFDLGERLVSVLTGQTDSFRSNLLKDSGSLITQGYWIRQFPDVINEGTEEERRIQFTTSMDDFIKHIDLLFSIAWWVEKEGNKEVMRVELLSETQQKFIGIKYGEKSALNFNYIQASKVKRNVLSKNFYSKIVLGSNKGGEGYEEVAGLQSICGRAEWSTINGKTNDSEYRKISPYSLSDIDIELPRRKQYEDFPETDTKYDSVLSVLDCKKIGNSYYLKKWQDIYEEAPKNIYSVDSAYNLNLTPARLLLVHGSVINAGLYHYPSDSINFSSSNCNSSLVTKKANEEELIEGDPIPHSILDTPRIKPFSIEFDLKVSQELEDKIRGINNGVQNWFGLVAVNTGTEIEYMRLNKVDTNREGKHQLVEAYI